MNQNNENTISPKSRPHKRAIKTDTDKTPNHDWLKTFLIGLTVGCLGAALFLPFQDGVLGWYAIVSIMSYPSVLGFWLFPITTLFLMRVVTTLHRTKLPILKSVLILILMILATYSLYRSDFHSNIGIGIFFWLVSGYLLFATTMRMRYPEGGLKLASAGVVLSLACMVWAQHANHQRKIHAVWHTRDAVLGDDDHNGQSAEWGAVLPPQRGGAPIENNGNNQAVIAKPLIDLPIHANSKIQVKRAMDLYNPWSLPNAVVSCETALKRNYPVFLPPRFLEDKYEWLNFHHGSSICNNLMYVGTPNGSAGEMNYTVSQDQRSNIYLMITDKKDKAWFSETFPMSREDNGLKNKEYIDKLNSVFVRLVDDPSIPMLDGEYTFTRAPVPTAPDVLPKGCEMKPVSNHPNVYQWGTARVDFRGQSVEKITTFCSKNHVAVAHLSHDPTQEGDVFENALHIKVFRSKDFRPIECGASSLNLTKQQAVQIYTGELKVEQLNFVPENETGCLKINAKFSDGTAL